MKSRMARWKNAGKIVVGGWWLVVRSIENHLLDYVQIQGVDGCAEDGVALSE